MTDSVSATQSAPELSTISDKAELLALVQEVHVPQVSSWPAPGWWLLAILLIGCTLAYWLRKRRQHHYEQEAWRREALAELTQLENRLPDASDKERHRLIQEASALLRRVMMQSRGRDQVAALTAEAWLNEVNAQAIMQPTKRPTKQGTKQGGEHKLDDSLHPLLTDVPYETQPNVLSSQENIETYFGWLQRTIESLPVLEPASGALL